MPGGNKKQEFESFNGPILFTTNCIVPPMEKAGYRDRIYTTGASGLPGAVHFPDRKPGQRKDFHAIIEHAKICGAPTEIETGEIIGGFAHNQVFELAGPIVEAVKTGAIRKFFVMAGCDGRMKERDYYTQFAEKLPKDHCDFDGRLRQIPLQQTASWRYQRYSPCDRCRPMQTTRILWQLWP